MGIVIYIILGLFAFSLIIFFASMIIRIVIEDCKEYDDGVYNTPTASDFSETTLAEDIKKSQDEGLKID